MDEPNDAIPRHGAESSDDFPGLYRDARPRRMISEDYESFPAPARTSETIWRADDDSPSAQRNDSLLDGILRNETDDDHDDDQSRHREPSATTEIQQPRFRSTIWYTILSTLLPGLGLVGSRRKPLRWVGVVVACSFVVLAGLGVVFFASRVHPDEGEGFLPAAASAAVGLASSRGVLHIATVLLIVLGLLWVAFIVGTHLATRPPKISTGKRFFGAVLVAVLSLAIASPIAVGAAYSQVLATTLNKTFATSKKVVSKSKPTFKQEDPNPFGDLKRLNILLIGSDLDTVRIERGVKDKYGFRTDTIILASVDTTTGETTLIQIPRNLQHTPFPEGSEMAQEFPDGFTGPGEEVEWHVNTIWEHVERDYPHLFEGQTYPGAEALKQGIEGITGLPVHYFLMLNIDGLRNLIDAMGGVTVNINERLPMGGNSENPEATSGWLEVGPNQHLNGRQGLWYARSRWSTSDYSRMERQSCLIKAITDQANPGTLLTRFEAIAGASSDMVLTDIPQEILEPLTDLALKTQKQPMKRLAFTMGHNGYSYENPDFEEMRAAVDETINPPAPSAKPAQSSSATASSSASAKPSSDETDSKTTDSKSQQDGSQDLGDACAFNPKR